MRCISALLLLASLAAPAFGDEAHTMSPLFSDLTEKFIEPHPVQPSSPLPSWLSFHRLINGFGQYGGIDQTNTTFFTFDYLFDVLSYVQLWKVEDGEVTYGHKMTQSNYYNSTVDGERPLLRSFGGITPPLTPAEKAKTLASVSVADNYNVNVVKVGSKTFTISDTVGQVEIDADTLDTVGGFEYADDLEALTSIISCAHPTQLPGDKYFYNYQTALFGNLPHISEVHKLQFYRVDTTKEPLSREVMIEIPMKDLSYLHQFANTPNYLVLLHYPLFWQVMGIATGTEILPHMKWDASKGTRVQVIDKRTWTITREYTTDATFAYHHLNAYEDGDNVIVDILTNICDDSTGDASCDDMNKFQLETLKDNSFFIKGSPLRRFTVPVTGDGDISWYDINNRGMGLHAVHPLMKGQKHRYAWALDNKGPGVWWNALVKIDMEKDDSASLQWYKEDHYPSEVSFIPRPGATEEDDGVLVSIVLGNDGAVKTSYMLVLDAKDMSVIATVPAPVHLPFPSHGHTCAPIETSPGVMENMCFWA